MSIFPTSFSVQPAPMDGTSTNGIGTCTSNDPQVQEAIDRTIEASRFGPEPRSAIAYQISQTMSDPTLTQEQKDAYIAALLGMANGGTGCDTLSPEQADAINGAFNEIGNAYSGENTQELRQQVTDSIARSVDSGALGADQIYGLVSKPGTAGARQLLTGIGDGNLLSEVSQRLVDDARREGYDINRYESGPQLLTAAADIANMAAAQGDSRAADAVLAEIDRVMKSGPVAGDMTLVQAMMATSLGSPGLLPERDGFHALSTLLNSSSSTAGNQDAQDRLFAALVRSADDSYVGGIDQGGERGAALDELGKYFEDNLSRLAETDWRKDNTGDFHHGLFKDFSRHVLLDEQYGRIDETNEAIAAEMRDLALVIGNTDLPAETRENAASTLGTIMGSLQWATADFIANAKGDAAAKTEFIRFFTDKLTDKLISHGASKLPEGDVRTGGTAAANGFVDAIWEGITDWMASGEIARGDEVTGGTLDLARIFRDAMSEGDASLLNAFDLRVELYYDPD
ncbi:hypothetical protein [Luteimonas arsenica]|uniref:hypothetical protein n=1 Tax=Luteimonas arsenica TaxID=1586242 RepID=UPI0010568652|nr:hypothetical protein [Luteimonas arsenica]